MQLNGIDIEFKCNEIESSMIYMNPAIKSISVKTNAIN